MLSVGEGEIVSRRRNVRRRQCANEDVGRLILARRHSRLLLPPLPLFSPRMLDVSCPSASYAEKRDFLAVGRMFGAKL